MRIAHKKGTGDHLNDIECRLERLERLIHSLIRENHWNDFYLNDNFIEIHNELEGKPYLEPSE